MNILIITEKYFNYLIEKFLINDDLIFPMFGESYQIIGERKIAFCTYYTAKQVEL